MSSRQASHLLPTYARVDLAFERGEGVWLTATDGERYLDFTSGVAVNALGHAHPHLVAAITEQANKVWHVSNLYRIPESERLAERLCAASFADVVFFANSGAEAMECAIKMARKYQSASGRPERYRIITFEGAFHGRTLATLAAGGQKKYLDGFGPVVEGFDQMPFGDLAATKRAIGPETAAILIEPIMGEGGVRVVEPEFLRALRRLCDEHGLLLIFDEVQTGMGRTGALFAYQRCGVMPDIMALAKALGGGFPLGACLATNEAANGMTTGTHGSTFGGNPLAMAAAGALLDVMLADGFLDRVRRTSLIPAQELRGMIAAGRAMKERPAEMRQALQGRTLAMIFDKPSTRTRVSFDVAMRQLGGGTIVLTGQEMQLGRGETIADTARVLSRYVDAIMIRILNHEALIELARHATVPVINGLTRLSHPCQVMADVMTFEEKKGQIGGHTVAWTGDANNVLSSWMHAAKSFDFRLKVAIPPELKVDRSMTSWAKQSGAAIQIGHDAEEAVADADCVVTDTWVSMGDRDGERRHNLLKPYQVNARLMAGAKPDAIFMHCLPAHRGDEVTDEVIDGPQSVGFDETVYRRLAQM